MKIKEVISHPVFFCIIGLIVCFTILSIMMKSCADNLKEGLSVYEKEKTEMKQCIGKKILLDKDTLTIINYRVLDAEFTLSNGAIISKDFAMKKIVNDSIELN